MPGDLAIIAYHELVDWSIHSSRAGARLDLEVQYRRFQGAQGTGIYTLIRGRGKSERWDGMGEYMHIADLYIV